MHQFPKFTPACNSTCFGQFLCPSSGVYSLYTRHWYMSYRFEDSFRAVPSWSCSKAVYKPVWHISVPSVQWINSWWWAKELPETSRVSCRSKFGKLVCLVGFIIKKSVTMHGHMNVKNGKILKPTQRESGTSTPQATCEPKIPVFDLSDALDRPNYVIGIKCLELVKSTTVNTRYGLWRVFVFLALQPTVVAFSTPR
jgi:hypothetical protein